MNGNKKIAYNSIILFGRLCISTLIGIFSSRFVIQALGVSDFGLYNVIGGIVTILNVINATMVATTYRFIATELGKGENGDMNKVFNTSFMLHVVFAVVILVFGLIIGLLYIDNILNVAQEKISDARFVLIISLLTTALSTLSIPYQGLAVAFENFKLTAIVDLSTQILRFIAILFLVDSSGNHLRLYSLIMMAYILLQAGLYFVYFRRRHFVVVRFRINKEKALYKKMLSFSVWTFYSSIANIGKTQGSTIILNFFFGTVVNAAYAVSCQVSNYVQVFANSLSSAAIPQITKNFSGGNIERSVELTCYISKYSFYLMAIVAFPAIMDMDWLLSIWLKDVPSGAAVFCRLVVLELLLGCFGAGIAALVQAKGNIMVFQLVVYTLFLLGLPLAFWLYDCGYSVYTISIIYCFISLISALLKVLLLKLYYRIDISKLVNIAYVRIVVVSVPLIISYIYLKPFGDSVLQHFVYLFTAEVILFLSIAVLGLDIKEKNVVRNQIRKILIK